MSEQEVYEQVLALLHEAVFDDAKWPAASGLIDTACKSKGNMLVFGEGTMESGIDIYFSKLLLSRAALSGVGAGVLPAFLSDR